MNAKKWRNTNVNVHASNVCVHKNVNETWLENRKQKLINKTKKKKEKVNQRKKNLNTPHTHTEWERIEWNIFKIQ